MRHRSIARRLIALTAALVIVQAVALDALAAGPTARPLAKGEVTGELFDASDLPSNQRLSERARQNARRTAALRSRERTRPGAAAPDAGGIVPNDERVSPGRAKATTSQTTTAAAVASVASGISLLHTQPAVGTFDPTGGIVGGKVVYATDTRITAFNHLPTGGYLGSWDNADFFNLPNADWYFGATVSASIYKGRWVAALASYTGPGGGCTTGYMNVAVSTSTDPLGTWRRYRLSIGDAWTDTIQIGVSDDKVVLSTNRWDLSAAKSDCLGTSYEGARLRVMDWADLLDGGTLTTKDVSPATYTSYYSWVAATNVAGTASTSAAKTLYLAGDKLVGTWGNFVFATITGSVKGGTVKLARNENLTANGTITQLTTPPDNFAALTTGNGGADERIVSASYRSGRLWASTTGSCRVTVDAPFRACARFIQLNTTTTPATKVESAYLTDVARDTWLPLVGFSRDGGSYFSVAASSGIEHEAIDELATYRAPGVTLVAGESEVPIWRGAHLFNDTYWGSSGSIMAVPNDARAVLALYPATTDIDSGTGWATQLRGGQSANPGGSIVKLGNGSGWGRSPLQLAFVRPLNTSPVMAMRVSASPDVTADPGGSVLVNGRDFPPLFLLDDLDLSDPSIGGNLDDGIHTLYAQWQTWDGTWSTPISSTIQIDTTVPTVTTPNVAFTTGTIGTSAPVKYTWAGSDAQSGIQQYRFNEERLEPTPLVYTAFLPAATTSITRTRRLDASYDYAANITVFDRAGNADTGGNMSSQFGSVQSSANMTFVKTWSTGSSTNYLGGTTRYATSAGATVTYTCTCRALAWITTKASNRGKAEVWVDGVLKATIDTYSSTTKYRQLAYQTSWSANGSHKIMIKVLGTSGRPRVDFDSFLKAY
jgi:hypothetical protein